MYLFILALMLLVLVQFLSWHMPRLTRTVALEVKLGDSDG